MLLGNPCQFILVGLVGVRNILPRRFSFFSRGSASSGDASAYTTADLIAAVTEKLTSIDSLYCECERQFSNSEERTKYRYARAAICGITWNQQAMVGSTPRAMMATTNTPS